MTSTENVDEFGGLGPLNPVSDMYAHVLYETPFLQWSMRMEDDDYVFTQSRPSSVDDLVHTGSEISEAVKHLLQQYRVDDPGGAPRDAFAIREAFDRLDPKKPSDVLRFLNAAGEFWYRDSVSLHQIMEWQRFAKLVRREDFVRLAIGIPSSDPDPRDADDQRDAREAMKAIEGFPNQFFIHSKPFSDWPPARPEWSPELQQKSLSSYRKSEEHSRVQLREHQMAFLRPQGNALQIEWRYADEQSREKRSKVLAHQQRVLAMNPSKEERDQNLSKKGRDRYWKRLKGQELKEAVMALAPPELARGTFNLRPSLVIRVHNVLDAIAAANYIDLIRGVKWKRCALTTCPRIFEVKSNHGQKCCNGPEDTCKNTLALQRRRRDPEKADKERMRARELALIKKWGEAGHDAMQRPSTKKKPQAVSRHASKSTQTGRTRRPKTQSKRGTK